MPFLCPPSVGRICMTLFVHSQATFIDLIKVTEQHNFKHYYAYSKTYIYIYIYTDTMYILIQMLNIYSVHVQYNENAKNK